MEKLYFVLPDDFLGQRITQKRVFFMNITFSAKEVKGGSTLAANSIARFYDLSCNGSVI